MKFFTRISCQIKCTLVTSVKIQIKSIDDNSYLSSYFGRYYSVDTYCEIFALGFMDVSRVESMGKGFRLNYFYDERVVYFNREENILYIFFGGGFFRGVSTPLLS